MDFSSVIGGDGRRQDGKATVEYSAQVASGLVNGEAKLTLSETALTVATLFDTVEVPFSEMNDLALVDYVVTVAADSGNYAFSRMGNLCEPFYGALCDAYAEATLRSLFVSGKPQATANGEYRYTEDGDERSGSAPIRVYENSVVILPPNLGTRRIPLCFVSDMEKGDFALALKLSTGESYTLSKLGYDTEPVEAAIEKQIRALREKTLAVVKEIDPGLTVAQASQIARLAPEGAAAPIDRLARIAPSFVAALESKLAETHAADSYRRFKEMCDPMQIWVGFSKNELTPAPCSLWLIAPSPDGMHAAVEFAEADSATFVYRTGGDFATFARHLNRALEAIAFKREVIRLSDEDLQKSENADYLMATKRTAALQFVRKNFNGRAIHTTPEAWTRKIGELWTYDKRTE